MKTNTAKRILSETPQEVKDKVRKYANEIIPKPIGDFIIENATGVQGVDGVYYHYTEVIKLLRLYEKSTNRK